MTDPKNVKTLKVLPSKIMLHLWGRRKIKQDTEDFLMR